MTMKLIKLLSIFLFLFLFISSVVAEDISFLGGDPYPYYEEVSIPPTPEQIFRSSVNRQLGEAIPNLGLNLLTLGWYGVYQRYNYYEDVNNVPSSYGEAFSESLDATPIAGSVKAAINADTGLERAGHISSAVGQGILIGVAAYKIAAGPKPYVYPSRFARYEFAMMKTQGGYTILRLIVGEVSQRLMLLLPDSIILLCGLEVR